jgi:chorismate mutase
MRGAFIVQLGPETEPAEGRFEGWVQEVDFCRELRFHSSEELLKFLGERFEVAKAVAEENRTGKKCQPVQQKRKRPSKETL